VDKKTEEWGNPAAAAAPKATGWEADATAPADSSTAEWGAPAATTDSWS